MTLTVLQFGVSGQLAGALTRGAPAAASVTALNHADADFLDPTLCAAHVERAQPDVVIIAAAYTQVDKAETEQAQAFRINAETPGAIASAAERIGAPVVYVSTDYVFDGAGGAPYAESAPTAPLNAYGRSKLAGERVVRAAQSASVVLRTSWVFDATGKNFLATMLRLGAERESLRVVDDQRGAPTAAASVAEAVWRAATALASDTRTPDQCGVFHFQGAPHASWADFAEEIFDAALPIWGRRPIVERISSSEYPTPAPRPLDTRLDCEKYEATFGLESPNWRLAARDAVAARLGGWGHVSEARVP